MIQNSSDHFDVVIVGGGMVGAALACALGEQNFSVAVIEGHAPQTSWPADEVDLRVSALTRASQNILINLGAWKKMRQLRVSPYGQMHVWDAGSSGVIHFDSQEIGEVDLGHIVENRVTQLALWEQMEGIGSIRLFCPCSLQSIDFSQGRLELDDGKVVSAELIVAADGRDSKVRTLAGIDIKGWAYDQHALVATVTPAKHHMNTAWQRFLPTGPLAFLPIDDGRCSIVWSTSPDEAAHLKGLDDSEFLSQLEKAIEGRLGSIRAVGPRGVFPLRLQHATSYVKPGLALVGDAAHAIHPLAGQGVNLGFLDAATLTDCLIKGRQDNRMPGDLRDLRNYERSRKGDNIAMLAAMDGFKRLFSNHNPILALMRGSGLRLANRVEPINHFFMHQALGLQGERPPLTRRISTV